MRWLNFIPLLIWAMLMVAYFDYAVNKYGWSKQFREGAAYFYLLGCLFWFIVAIILSWR